MKELLDFIYPPVCSICGKLDKNSICKKCEIMLNRQAIFGIDDYSRKMRYFSEHIYVFKYDGEIRKMLLNYKFNDKPYIYNTFVNFLKKNEKIFIQIKKYDIIIPVPISKKRFKERGYNQSELIARKIAKYAGIKYANNVLIKTKNNIAQSLLEEQNRKENVKGVYKLLSLPNRVNGKSLPKIEIVDMNEEIKHNRGHISNYLLEKMKRLQ